MCFILQTEQAGNETGLVSVRLRSRSANEGEDDASHGNENTAASSCRKQRKLKWMCCIVW